MHLNKGTYIIITTDVAGVRRTCITGIARTSGEGQSITAREVMQVQAVKHDIEVGHKNQML